MTLQLDSLKPNKFKKTLAQCLQPDEFHFYYQKQNKTSIGQLSPTSTCPSQGKSNYWECQFQDKTIQIQKSEQNLTSVQFGSFEGNLLGLCLQKYSMEVSKYIKQNLDLISDKILEFVLVDEFKGLDLQKQQFSIVLSKFNDSQKSTNNKVGISISQNSTLRCFLEDITYLNYEQINFQLIYIIGEMYAYKMQNMGQNKKVKEFLYGLSQNEEVHYINFMFLNNRIEENKRQKCYIHFLGKLFQIISQIYVHFKVFEQQQKEGTQYKVESEVIRNELKLFSSQRDILDSEDEEQCMKLSCPSKKIKHSCNP